MGLMIGDSYAKEFGEVFYTDDTQQTMLLTESILQGRGFNPKIFADNLINMFENECLRGWGQTTLYTLKILSRDKDWTKSGDPSGAGNGGAMRIAPLGLFYYDDPDLLKKHVKDSCIITHKDERAVGGATAIAYGISYVIRNKDFEEEEFLEEVGDFVKDISKEMSDKIKDIKSYLYMDPKEAFKKTGIGGFVLKSVPAAIYGFLNSKYDFRKTLETILEAKGDKDTNSAMGCALSGAFLGYEKIPKSLIEGLEIDSSRNNFKGKNYMEELALKLYELKTK